LRLADERKKYDARVQAYASSKQFTPPLCKGVLVFDEVKVAAKLHWNSRNDTIVGHTMTSQEMATLSDLYLRLEADNDGTNKTDYILQTLWRDLTTESDIVGSYYTSTGPFKAKSMLPCVMDALRKFYSHGFKVYAFVCDGASSNLTMIKTLLGVKGPFHRNQSLSDPHEVTAYFTNPFTGEKIHVIICPSHQV